MGYRVGYQCFDTEQSATDYKMSLVVPVITSDGKLIYPVKQNDVWLFVGQPITLSHGSCEPMQDYAQGLAISSAFIGLLVTVFMIRTAIRSINEIDRSEREHDE